MSKPIIAIVGRPNVGKSTLFNRLVGERLAIVSDTAGTTRDRLYADTDFAGREFTVVDTGGLEMDMSADLPGTPAAMLASVRTQAHPPLLKPMQLSLSSMSTGDRARRFRDRENFAAEYQTGLSCREQGGQRNAPPERRRVLPAWTW
jgi:hypothetical protein